ncbi:MAG: transketolase C-terminal domain-containing protein [Thermodesulfobacteriota bacterium]|nr:transketolase C-terminal domain-containing protein [Thermodesulfobacteriota bacterium]
MERVISGNEAVAHGAMLSRVQVIPAYPISPQTTIVEALSDFCASGRLKADFVRVESEHSAMACCIGAASAGARTFTATSAQGLALMHELLHWAAGSRLPIVMANVNRAMSAPWTMWCDQGDSLSQRDTGWLQFYCEDNQEVLDSIIMAYRISEKVLLPSMVCLDGFILSHTYEQVEIPDISEVDQYLPSYTPQYKLDVEDPHSFNAAFLPDMYMEQRMKMQESMEEAKIVAREVDKEFGQAFGRSYGMMEEYRVEDADILLVTTGTVTGTARVVVDEYRRKGEKVGLLKMKMFRPFPTEEVRRVLQQARKVAVVDRNISFGSTGIFAQEIRSALHHHGEGTSVFGFIAGLGGRDVTPAVLKEIVEYAKGKEAPEGDIAWIGAKP